MIVFSLWMLVFTTLRKGALQNPEYRKMEVPLIAYNLLILAMVISALMTHFRTGWQPISAGLVSIGAVLFLFSDALLAFDRFIQAAADRAAVEARDLSAWAAGHHRRCADHLFRLKSVLFLNGLNPSPKASFACPMTIKASGSASWTMALSRLTSARVSTQYSTGRDWLV